MNRKIQTIDEMRPNIFEAIKRAFIKRGVVPRPRQPMAESKADAKKSRQPEVLESHTQSEPPTTPDKESEKGLPGPKRPKPKQTLHEITGNSQDVLFEASTVFPFTLVPDTIKLDREKLTVAHRYFWKTANITSTPVSEIMSCEANVGPIFGSIHLTFRFFADNQREIRFFWREDALYFQRIMHGYIIANRKEIDVSHVPTEELVELLMDLGTGASD